jgi:Concanavalin A-like lectin/glucanases superfamily
MRSVTGLTVAGQVDIGATLDAATAYLGGIEPLHWFDFVNDEAVFSSVFRGNLANTPGWSFTRSTVGTAETVAGSIVQFPSGVLRRTDRGFLPEGARTNLFLNSETGVTQDVTVAATSHTLSFRGTGTITLSGTSTAGPLVGTGANDTVSLTFTPTAGTLTLTVSGSCTNVQLEAGAFRSSWIPTAGASVTRNADILKITGITLAYPYSLWVEYDRVQDTGTNETLIQLDPAATGNTESAYLRVTSADKAEAALQNTSGLNQGSVVSAASVSAGTVVKIAGRFASNAVNVALSGVAGTEDPSSTIPTAPDRITIGARGNDTVQAFNYIRRIAIFNTALSDANLQTITS